jgi:hypothetical protein
MTKRLFVILMCVLLSGLLLVQIAVAMSSTHYRLDWFTPLTTSGGGTASSTHYAVSLTIGQTVIGSSSGINYKTGLGYWYGAGGIYRTFLPIVLK